jgi:hypothetical protein
MKDAFAFTIEIVVVLLLIAAIGATSLITATSAQTSNPKEELTFTTGLGEPYFEETGKITGQTEIGPNRTQVTFTTNGTLNGNIEVTNIGDFVSVSKGNNLTFDQGQGIIATKDGSETANYTIMAVGNVTQEGKLVFQGAAAYSTNSTGQLAFLNNELGIFKGEADEGGNLVSTEWEWK